ncbi:hypothetical protein ACFV0W_42255 [Streptomyces anulatus]
MSGARTPAAVRPQRIAPPLIVARRPAMPLRQIAGLVPAAPAISATSPASAPSSSAAPSGPAAAPAVQRSASERRSGPDRTVPEGDAPSPDRVSGRPTADVVRPALGRPLREMPAGARTAGPDGPAGGVPVPPRPAHPPAHVRLGERHADEAPGAPGGRDAGAPAPGLGSAGRAEPSRPDSRDARLPFGRPDEGVGFCACACAAAAVTVVAVVA